MKHQSAIALLLAFVPLAACGGGGGGGTVQYATTKYPEAPDRLARVEKGAIASGCNKLSSGVANVSFGCDGGKALVISDDGKEGLSVTCSGYSKDECAAMLDKFVAAGN